MAPPRAALAERIVDAALKRADTAGWADVRFHDIAGDLKISLAEVYATYADLDAVGDALLSRADRAMLEASAERGFAQTPARARLSIVITRWLDALAPHRRIVGEMLRYKFQPAHVHLQAALVVRLSRTRSVGSRGRPARRCRTAPPDRGNGLNRAVHSHGDGLAHRHLRGPTTHPRDSRTALGKRRPFDGPAVATGA